MTEATAKSMETAVNLSLERYLGNTIRELRQQHGLTIAEVADRVGPSRGMLSKVGNAQTTTSIESLA